MLSNEIETVFMNKIEAMSRFSCENLVIHPIEHSRSVLIEARYKEGSIRAYDSRMRTLSRYLRATKPEYDGDVMRCTKEEFFSFLMNWLSQKRGPARPTLSALKKVHTLNGLSPATSWAWDRDTKQVVEGAGANYVPVDKGVMSPDQFDDCDEELRNADATVLGKCAWCKTHHDPYLRERCSIAMDFLREVAVRGADMQHVQDSHLKRAEGHATMLYVPYLKTGEKTRGGDIVISGDGVMILEEAMKYSKNGYAFPKCVMIHLSHLLKHCSTKYGWDEGLLWTPHCERHSQFNSKEKVVADAMRTFINGVSAPTTAHYARSNENRNKRARTSPS